MSRISFLSVILLATIFSGCSTTSNTMIEGDFSRSSVEKTTVVSSIPDYSENLHSLSGKGRALVSEPGNSDRVTIDFEANRELSLLTIQNRIGIEGGQMLVDKDSILIYNRLDKEAQKISIYDGRMTSLNELTSINILDLINFTVKPEDVRAVLESNNLYQLRLSNGSQVFVNKENGQVEQVFQDKRNTAPYSRIIYESHGELNGFILPRKITIFSSDGNSRVVFLIRALEVNSGELDLKLDIPESIKIQRL